MYSKEPLQQVKIRAEGRFWRSSSRGIQGCDWRKDPSIPERDRLCTDAFNLRAEMVGTLADDGIVTIRNYYKKAFWGEYWANGKSIKDWAAKNGFYRSKKGELFLAMPVSMWHKKEDSSLHSPEELTGNAKLPL